MKFQFSLRFVLLLLMPIAAVSAWYASNTSTRDKEVRALSRLQKLTWGSLSESDISNTENSVCGSWVGALAYTHQVAPSFLRRLDLDAFRRVKHLEFQYVSDPGIVDELDEFDHLKYVRFGSGTASSKDLVDAIAAFRLSHPEIEIHSNRRANSSDDWVEDATPFGDPFQF